MVFWRFIKDQQCVHRAKNFRVLLAPFASTTCSISCSASCRVRTMLCSRVKRIIVCIEPRDYGCSSPGSFPRVRYVIHQLQPLLPSNDLAICRYRKLIDHPLANFAYIAEMKFPMIPTAEANIDMSHVTRGGFGSIINSLEVKEVKEPHCGKSDRWCHKCSVSSPEELKPISSLACTCRWVEIR